MTSRRPSQLDERILEVFRMAQAAGRPDVAEQLLKALECLCEPIPGTALERIYLSLCDGELPTRTRRSD